MVQEQVLLRGGGDTRHCYILRYHHPRRSLASLGQTHRHPSGLPTGSHLPLCTSWAARQGPEEAEQGWSRRTRGRLSSDINSGSLETRQRAPQHRRQADVADASAQAPGRYAMVSQARRHGRPGVCRACGWCAELLPCRVDKHPCGGRKLDSRAQGRLSSWLGGAAAMTSRPPQLPTRPPGKPL